MELVFNELSFLPHSNNEVVLKNQFYDMLKVFEHIQGKYGFKHIIFPSNIGDTLVTAGKTFLQWVYAIPHQGEKNKILSLVKRPFGNDVLENQVMELNRYYYHNEEAGIIEKYCVGLAISYLKDKVAISLASNPCWCLPHITFKEIIDDELNTQDVIAGNIAVNVSLDDVKVQKALMYAGELELIESPLSPGDKDINLRDDHGKDKLKAFAKRILHSKHIISIINSLPFNPNDINLIKEIYPDGKIELVLYWESAGYGMVIQTTGRNYRETEAIAEIIKQRFDR